MSCALPGRTMRDQYGAPVVIIASLPVCYLLWAASLSGVSAQHHLEGAWRKNLTKLPGCSHSGLQCKNGGYFDQDACMSHVPCRQTGSKGFDLWETWDLAPDYACTCPIGFGGVDCGVVLNEERCGAGLVLDRSYDATVHPLNAQCHVVITDAMRPMGLRHHFIMWSADLRKKGAGTMNFRLSARNKDDDYNARNWNHSDGGGRLGSASKWAAGLAPEAGPRFSSDWRTCAPAADNLKCSMSQCVATKTGDSLAPAGGVTCAASTCSSCHGWDQSLLNLL